MNLFEIGITGGGTRTRGVLFRDGRPVGRPVVAGPSNPGRVGPEAACLSILQVLEGLRRQADGPVARVAFGISGAGLPPARRALLARLGEAVTEPFRLCTDADATLSATAGRGPGVVLIAGTGSVALARDRAGQVRQVGGTLPPGGDPGSATAIALSALRDPALAARIGGSVGPAAAVRVDVLAREGDAGALAVLEEAARRLARLVEEATERGFPEGAFPLGLVGGVVTGSEIVRTALLGILARTRPFLRPGPPAMLPERGALEHFEA